MPTNVVRLVNDKKPVLAVAVALGLSLAPVYCALFWKWSGLSDHQGLHLWPVVFPMHVVPAIAYFAVLNLTMRRRVQAWWLVPARPEHIGRALWWLAIGIPAGVLMVGMAVDAAIVEPILRNPKYFDVAAARFVTLSIFIVNWGAWNLLRNGRFRYRNASGPLGGGSDHAKMLWPSVAILLVMLAIFEFHFIGPLSSNVFEPAWTAIGGYMVLVLTGAVFYALPKLPIWLNALMEEVATSNASKKLSAVAPWSWALVGIFGLGLSLFRAGESIWASQVDRVSFVDFLARAWLGVVHFVWVNAVFWYAIFMTWALYTMLRSRSVSRTSPLLEKILDSWPRRGWHGLYKGRKARPCNFAR